jgi:hypothetical protein
LKPFTIANAFTNLSVIALPSRLNENGAVLD